MTTKPTSTLASLTEQNSVINFLSVMCISELFLEVSQYLTHFELLELVNLNSRLRGQFIGETWRSILTSDEKTIITVTRSMKSRIDSARYVPLHCLKNVHKYRWIKCEAISTIDFYKCSDFGMEHLSTDEIKPFCNLRSISIHKVSAIIKDWEDYKEMVPIHSNLFKRHLDGIMTGGLEVTVCYDIARNNHVLTYSNNQVSSETYETTITRNNYFLLNDYATLVSLVAHDIDNTPKLSEFISNIDSLVNLKRLTFYPSSKISFQDYKAFMKVLDKLPRLEDLKTLHFIGYRNETYSPCKYAPRHLKSYEVKVYMKDSVSIAIQRINLLTGPISQVTSALFIRTRSIDNMFSIFDSSSHQDFNEVLNLLPNLPSLGKTAIVWNKNSPQVFKVQYSTWFKLGQLYYCSREH